MNENELTGLLESLRRMGSDDLNVEVKESATTLSRDVWETVSAFANTAGGIIVLGVSERAGFVPEECAVVEDSRNGCVSGITAGCHVFAVPDIVPLPQDVVDGCEAVLDTLFDLTAAVKAVR